MFSAIELPINVRDIDEGRQWFAEVLGITFGDHNRVEINGVTLVLFAFPDVQPCSHVVAQIVTDDLGAAQATLRDRGAVVGEIDPHNWNLIITDPTGNRIAVYEPR